jgi:integrase/recombinase XerD
MSEEIVVQPQPRAWPQYLEADLSMKERALDRLQPTGAITGRFRPPDQLMQFLQSL